jgi:hypothetical protein
MSLNAYWRYLANSLTVIVFAKKLQNIIFCKQKSKEIIAEFLTKRVTPPPFLSIYKAEHK